MTNPPSPVADAAITESEGNHRSLASGSFGSARRQLALALVFGAVGCSRPPPSSGPITTAAPTGAASTEIAINARTERPTEPPSSSEAFVDFVRREAWDEAASSIDALPEEAKSRPQIRLVRGRVAMARGEYELALRKLEGLEREIGVPIGEDLERWRAEAASVVGPFAAAAEYYSKQGGLKGFAKAAQAFRKAAMNVEARDAANRAIEIAKGNGRGNGRIAVEELQARALRAELAQVEGHDALASEHLRFIVVQAPASDEAKAAIALLEKLDPSHPLTGKERLLRAERLIGAARTDDALTELDRAQKAPTPPDTIEINWMKALALYKSRTRYDKAAALFDSLAQKPGPRQAESLYYAARAHSRVDHDVEAAAMYRSVVQRFPTTGVADDSGYLAARLAFLHAEWGDAAAGYASYLRKFAKGKHRDAASYEHAVALLADGKNENARTELHALAEAAKSTGEAARLRQLEAIAASRKGNDQAAITLWEGVVRAQPLSWAAMLAGARLAQKGVKAPPPIEPGDGAASDPASFTLPPAVQLYHGLGLDDDAAKYIEAHERQAVADLGGRRGQALCALYGTLGRAARSYRVGLEAVSSSLLMRAPSPASQWGWHCVYPRPYLAIVREIEARERLPTGLIYAVMRQESAFDPNAVSHAHAVGLLQLLPDTARKLAGEIGIDFKEQLLTAPAVNLRLGGRYVAKMLDLFNGSAAATAAAYNAGPRAVRRWLTRMKGLEIDIWAAAIPYDETRDYLSRVMSNMARYAYLEGGEAALPAIKLALPSVSDEAGEEGNEIESP